MNIEEIEKEIAVLENGDTTWANIEKLSKLYVVRDHYSERIVAAGNEFCEACDGVMIDKVMGVLAEHFEVIKVLHPKEYQSVIRRIKE